MYSLMPTPLYNYGVSKFPLSSTFNFKHNNNTKFITYRKHSQLHATNKIDAQTGKIKEEPEEENLVSEQPTNETKNISTTTTTPLGKDLKKVVQKTASTFAPRASKASKNPKNAWKATKSSRGLCISV